MKSYSIKELLHELLDKTIELAKQKDISVEADFTHIYNDNIKTNKERFTKAIYAVLENAINYTPNGGHISFNARQGSNVGGNKIRYVFTVKDNGIGMSKEFLSHVFDEFAREKDTTNSKVSGSGLGLTISKNILQSTGGDIIINSELDKGTEVIMVAVLNVDDNTTNNNSIDLLNEPSGDSLLMVNNLKIQGF